MAQQGPPPRRSARLPASGRPDGHDRSDDFGRSGGSRRSDDFGPPEESGPAPRPGRRPGRSGSSSPWRSDAFPADTDQDLPPWAGPGIYANRPGLRELRPPDSELPGQPAEGGGRRRGRAAAARLRKSRRRVLVTGAAAVIVAFAVAAVLVIHQQHKSPAPSGFVQTLQPGEFRAVPSACTAVSTATLDQYIPGTPRRVTHSIASSTESQCTFTVDVRPVFRVLEVTSQAYLPSGLATGNGSATNNAIDNYLLAQQQLANPAKKTRQPKAVISSVAGIGNAAFSALQHFRVGGEPTDIVTLLVRDRNAVITIKMQASFDSHQAAGGSRLPVPVSQLRAAALAVARQVQAGVAAGPTAGS